MGDQTGPRVGKCGTKKAQSALEYLLTYSWSILLVSIIIAIIYFFVVSPQTIVSSACVFSTGAYCRDLVFGSNTVSGSSTIGVFLTNTWSYLIVNPQIQINFSGVPVTTGTCQPANVLPGGAIICNITLSQKSLALGTLVTGRLYLSASPCPSGNPSDCQSTQPQTYVGHFDTHVIALLSPPTNTPINVTLTVQNKNPAPNGAGDRLTAIVKLYGTPIGGATVTFNAIPAYATINPSMINTDSNGNAYSYVSSLTPGNVLVTASFANVSAIVVITFTIPATTIPATSSTSTSTSTTSTASTSITSTIPQTLLSKFVETGLPQGVTWNVTYNGVVKTPAPFISWNQTNSYPFWVFLQSCTSYNNYIYCVGGTVAQETDTNLVYYAPISSSGVGVWSATTSYPLYYGVDTHSCVSYNGYIYCIAGANWAPSTNANNVYYAPISSNGIRTWSSAAPYPINVTYPSCATSNGIIYCVGGADISGGKDNVYYASVQSNSSISAWLPTTPYPLSVYGHSCATSNGYIYCVGGVGSGSAVYYAPISSTGVGTWSTTAPYPTLTFHFSCASSNGYIYCVGGYAGGAVPSVYYAPVSSTGIGAWLSGNAYPVSVDYHSCVASNSTVYCVGGAFTNAVYYSPINTNANTITFLTQQGNYTYTIANQVSGGKIYVSSPSSGYAPAGGTVQVTFITTNIISTTTSSTTSTTTVSTTSIAPQCSLLTRVAPSSAAGRVNPTNGTILNCGTNTIINATPNSGYLFFNWTCHGTGCYSGGANPAAFTLIGNVLETANFFAQPNVTYACNSMTTLRIGYPTVACSQFMVNLTAIGSPNANGLSPALLGVYSSNKMFINSFSLYPNQTANVVSGNSIVSIYVNMTHQGLYWYQKWAQVRLSPTPPITTTVTTSTITTTSTILPSIPCPGSRCESLGVTPTCAAGCTLYTDGTGAGVCSGGKIYWTCT